MSIVRAFLAFSFLLTTAACPAQTFTARPNTSINPHCNGFYENLPLGYDAGGANLYPLIIAALRILMPAETGTIEIRILDERGRLVQQQVGVKPGRELARTIDLGGLGRGTYLLQVTGRRQRAVEPFLR